MHWHGQLCQLSEFIEECTHRENVTVHISTYHSLLHHASNSFTLVYVKQQQEEEEENVDDGDVQSVVSAKDIEGFA